MRTPIIRDKLYQILRKEIFSGKRARGSRIPEERALCREYHVARETLRSALQLLEEDDLIRRHPGKGTFITAGTGRTIVFLVPCVDYLIQSGEATARNLMRQFCGILRCATTHNYQLVTLPASRTNSPSEIDRKRLERLNETSLLYIPGAEWYPPLDEIYESMNWNVVLQNVLPRSNTPLFSYAGKAPLILSDTEDMARRAIRKLVRSDCHHIVCASMYLTDHEIDPITRAAQSILRECDISNLRITMLNLEKGRRQLTDFYGNDPFDGLFLGLDQQLLPQANRELTLAENLDLPSHLRIILHNFSRLNNELKHPCPYYEFNQETIGELAGKLLIYPETEKKIHRIKATYHKTDEKSDIA